MEQDLGVPWEDVLDSIDRLIQGGTLEKTAGFYALVRRPARRTAASAREAALRKQIADLGRRRDAEGVPFLLRVLVAAEQETDRALAAAALGDIGDEQARAGLTTALDDGSADVRRAAEDALRRIATQT